MFLFPALGNTQPKAERQNQIRTTGISQNDYESVLQKISDYYEPIVLDLGFFLSVRGNWNNHLSEATATREDDTIVVRVSGALARQPQITKDGLFLITCSTLGFHLGGAPKRKVPAVFSWSSHRSQADFYATLRCLRLIFKDEDNEKWVQENSVDPFALSECRKVYNTKSDESLCARISMAGLDTAKFIQVSNKEKRVPSLNTPDIKVVKETKINSKSQCRLDTYFAGALCKHDTNVQLSDVDPNIGTCSRKNKDSHGVRPLCWYKPPPN